MSLISVIVPVYKAEKYLYRCVDSILRQTFTDFELILVDDGSPDNCGAICDEFAMQDERVHVLHQENKGVAVARNVGLDWIYANSPSKWISFIDSDDWVNERYLELLLKASNEIGKSIAICGHKVTSGEEMPTFTDLVIKEYLTEDFYCNNYLNATVPWGKLYHRECFEQIRYPLGKIHEDEYVTYKIIFRYSTITYIDAGLYAYYKNEEGITKSQWTFKRLDDLPARKEQMDFFKKSNYKKAYVKVCKMYCNGLATSIQKMIEQNVKEKTIDYYRKQLRMALLKHYNITELRFKKNNYWIYDKAFPKLMFVFWGMIGVKDKFKGIGGKAL